MRGIPNQQHLRLLHLLRAYKALPERDGAVDIVLTLLLNDLFQLVAEELRAGEAHGGPATEVAQQDVAAQLSAEGALVPEVLQKEQVPVQGVAVLDLRALEGRAHLEKVTQGAAVPVQVQVFSLRGKFLLQIFITLKESINKVRLRLCMYLNTCC